MTIGAYLQAREEKSGVWYKFCSFRFQFNSIAICIPIMLCFTFMRFNYLHFTFLAIYIHCNFFPELYISYFSHLQFSQFKFLSFTFLQFIFNDLVRFFIAFSM